MVGSSRRPRRRGSVRAQGRARARLFLPLVVCGLGGRKQCSKVFAPPGTASPGAFPSQTPWFAPVTWLGVWHVWCGTHLQVAWAGSGPDRFQAESILPSPLHPVTLPPDWHSPWSCCPPSGLKLAYVAVASLSGPRAPVGGAALSHLWLEVRWQPRRSPLGRGTGCSQRASRPRP